MYLPEDLTPRQLQGVVAGAQSACDRAYQDGLNTARVLEEMNHRARKNGDTK